MPQKRTAPTATVSLDARRSDRLGMLWVGEIVLHAGRYECRIIDISQHGAKLATEAAVRPGDEGLLLCEGLDLLFRVVRHEFGIVAVSFVDELDQDVSCDDTETVSRLARNQQIFRYLTDGLGGPFTPRAGG